MVGTGYEEVRHQIEAIPYVMGGTPGRDRPRSR